VNGLEAPVELALVDPAIHMRESGRQHATPFDGARIDGAWTQPEVSITT
jgi:hypothetical protein